MATGRCVRATICITLHIPSVLLSLASSVKYSRSHNSWSLYPNKLGAQTNYC